MKTIIGTKQNVTKELTALVADVLAHKPEANIAVSAVDLPEEVLGALAKSDLAFDKATLFQACEYCGAAGKGVHAVGAAFQVLTAAKPFAAVHAPDPDADAEHAADYDTAIQAAGGLDLVILGLAMLRSTSRAPALAKRRTSQSSRRSRARPRPRPSVRLSRRRSRASRSASIRFSARKRSCLSPSARAARRRSTPRSPATRRHLPPRHSCSCTRMLRFILTKPLLRSYNK